MRYRAQSILVALAVFVLACAAPRSARAQASDTARNRTPRFFFVATPRAVPVEFSSAPILRRLVTATLEHVTLVEALTEIARQVGIQLVYSEGVVPATREVSLTAQNLTLAAALTQVLLDTRLDVVFSANGKTELVPRSKVSVMAVKSGVHGQVTDGRTGAVLVGATVQVQGQTARARTDTEGKYRIAGITPGLVTFVVTRLGYTKIERKVEVTDGNDLEVNIALDPAASVLHEMVTTVTGERSRLEVGNSIGTIKADSLVPTSLIRNMSDLLTARTPGVIVTNSSGMVGAPSLVRVRGVGSMSLSNDPIIVVDGVRMAAATNAGKSVSAGSSVVGPAPGLGAYSGATTSRLDDIDPSIIESIDVLRGPAASSLYGPDAVAGVIVIKTKKGAVGSWHANIATDQGVSMKPFIYPLQWQAYAHTPAQGIMTRCGWYNVGWSPPGAAADQNAYDGTCTVDSIVSYDPLNNPRTTTLGKGTANTQRINLSGGTEQLREFMALASSNTVGMTKMPDYEWDRIQRMWQGPIPSWVRRPNSDESITGSSRTTAQLSHALDLSIGLNGVYRNTLVGGPGGLQTGAGTSGVLGQAFYDTLANLPAEGMRSKQVTLAKRGYTSVSANYTPLSWLVLGATLGGDYTLRTDDALGLPSLCTAELAPATGCVSGHRNTRGETFVTTADLRAQASWMARPWMSLRTTVGEQLSRTTFYSLAASNGGSTNLAFGTELLSPAPVATSGTPQLYSVTESRDETAAAGWYVEETASMRERLFLTAAFRKDVSSNFGPFTNTNTPIYPKFSLSWVLSDEPFFHKPSWVSSLWMRAAYGHSGQAATQASVLKNYTTLTTIVDGATVQALRVSSIGNPNLLPERSEELEGGFDVAFLEDRLHVEITNYRKFSVDAISTRTLPPSETIGSSSSQSVNLGNVENRGWELLGTAQIIDRRSFRWELTVNATWNTNKLVTAATSTDANWFRGYSNRVGYPLQSIFDHPITAYTDFNHDGLLTTNEVRFAPTLLYIGNMNPDGEMTYTNAFDFWGGAIRLNAVIDNTIGKSVSFPYRSFITSGSEDREYYHIPLGDYAAMAEWIQGFTGGMGTNFHSRKANLIRIGEVSLTGNLPPRLATRLLRSKTASLTVAGRNLARWTSSTLKDFDGSRSPTDIDGLGQTGLVLPQPVEWTVRINLGI